MTIEANHGPAPAGSRSPAFARERERAQAVLQARRHSRVVRVLKFALPVVALAVGGLYFLSSGFTVSLGPMEASISRIEVSGEALRMVNPKIEGVTDDGGAFVVRADYADQDVAKPTQITLSAVQAELVQPDKGWSRLAAPRGHYDSKTEALQLLDNIQVTSESGLHAYLTSADIDLNKQTVASREPVRVEMPNGTVRADSLHIDMAKSELAFESNVRVRVQRPPKDGATAAAAAPRKGLGGMSLNSREPIDIAAPKLIILDKDKVARFLGGVTAVQGDSRMTSQELKVHYASDEAGASTGGSDGAEKPSADIRLIEAIDQVHLVTSEGRQANGQHMVFDTQKQTILLQGGVVIADDGDTLKGESLIVDLTTGISRFGPQSRVQGHFAARGKPSSGEAAPQTVELGSGSLDLSGTQGKPIDIDADTLTVDDRKRVAVFTGNVRAVQGDMTVRSRELTVDFSGEGGEAGAAQPGSEIEKIRAEGKVLITSRDQTSTSDWAVFDVNAQTVTIGGNVVLSQGENVIKGDRLVIDVTTGRSRFENEGDLSTGNRVRGLFRPKSSDQNGRQGPGARPGGGFFAAPGG